MIDFATIDLDNCHWEPIHIPARIQPHGLLIALDLQGRLTHVSQNAASMLPGLPALGSKLPQGGEGTGTPLQPLWEAIAAVLNDTLTGQESAPLSMEVVLGCIVFDAVLHSHDGRVIVELERRSSSAVDLGAFALLAHRSMGRLHSRKDLATLLGEAVGTLRQLTGFDRVMAYRFHPDDSGEVVAEEHEPGLEPFLHRRFPASDIPVQARALYVLNPLRLIADVNDAQVPIEVYDPAARPLDLSHSVLRSVSPIHIEYLRNIEVAASMSLSIIVHGRLWGLIACHHASAHRVPYAVRMTCDVFSRVLSSAVQSAVDRLAAKRRQASAEISKRLNDLLVRTDDFATDFHSQVRALAAVIHFDDALCVYGGVRSASSLSADAASVLLQWLDAGEDDLVMVQRADQLPEPVRNAVQPFCGLLALCIDRVNRGWIVLLRHEQVQTIVWSGIPAKLARIGPLGARLTPSGSMAQWRQTVEGTAVGWDDTDRAIAQDLIETLGPASAARAARMAVAQAQLLAVLGHDLREPLQTISMMGKLLEHDGTERQVGYGKRIARSIGRMQRLIGEVFEMSSLRAGLGLAMSVAPGNMAGFVRTLVEDASVAHPEIEVMTDIPTVLEADFDPDRMAQLFNNLLSNARNHGIAGEAVWVTLRDEAPDVVLQVVNKAPPIPKGVIETLFEPFKPKSVGNARNPGGLGLGLYIASEIVKGHRGRIDYRHDGIRVIFTATIPQRSRA